MLKEQSLTAPNRGALWLNLALTKTQLAELCGLTTRQIGYWTQRGYLTCAPHHPDRYNGNAVDLCILIKQGLDQGLTFQRALAYARRCLKEEAAGQPGLDAIGAEDLRAMREQLSNAVAAVAMVLEAVEPLAPRAVEERPAADDE